MKDASKVIMGATLVMVVSIAIVLGLVLVLLAELYCTLLLRRRQLRITSSNGIATASAALATTTVSMSPTGNTTTTQPPQAQNHSASPRTTDYAPGVLEVEASINLFYPPLSYKENKVKELRHILQVHAQESKSSPQHIGLIKTSPSSVSLVTSIPHQIGETQIQINANEKANGGGEHFVYISNPIYDNDGSRASRVETPFETPDSSPSRLETGSGGGGGSSSSDEERVQTSPPSPASTPPLTPMKKLPAVACSVSLRDARSLGTSGSDSVSSSSSGSPCTSPSW